MEVSGRALEALEEEEDDSFQVRDLLVWSAEDSKESGGGAAHLQAQPAAGDRPKPKGYHVRGRRAPRRPGLEAFQFDAVSLFYAGAMVLATGVAELVMKPLLERIGATIILQLQRHGEGKVALFEDVVGFSPHIWAWFPSVCLTILPSWRPVGARMLLLQGVGLQLKWALNLMFQQGRPFWIDKKIEMWHCTTVYGFPSGHAMLLLLCIAPIIDELWNRVPPSSAGRPRRPDGHVLGSAETPSTTASAASAGAGISAALGSLTVLLLSSALVCLYLLCCVGRMFLGTHYWHDLVMGAATGAMLLQVLTKHNVAVFADRIMMSMEPRRDETYKRLIEVLLRSAATALCLVGAAYGYLALVNHFSTPDPPVWAKRAEKGCGIPPDTREGSLDKAYEAAGIVTGWVTSVMLLTLHRRSAQAERSFLSVQGYGTVQHADVQEGSLRTAALFAPGNGVASSLSLIRAVIMFGVAVACAELSFDLGLSFWGHFLCTVLVLYFNPTWVEHIVERYTLVLAVAEETDLAPAVVSVHEHSDHVAGAKALPILGAPPVVDLGAVHVPVPKAVGIEAHGTLDIHVERGPTQAHVGALCGRRRARRLFRLQDVHLTEPFTLRYTVVHSARTKPFEAGDRKTVFGEREPS
ncbi:acidPPc domain-containing protein, partial [Durusdinium trenchii]